MSYTAPDLADDVQGVIEARGYSIVESDDGFRWEHAATHQHGHWLRSQHTAVFYALANHLNRLEAHKCKS